MSDERDHEPTVDRLQEILEGRDPEIESRVAGSPELRTELERLRKLDAMLMDAVPEVWTAARTERVLAALPMPPAPRPRSGLLLRMALSAAAAIVGLAIWGGPVISAVHAAPDHLHSLAAGLGDGLLARTSELHSVPAGPLAGAAIVLLLVTLTVGARTVRALTIPERNHG